MTGAVVDNVPGMSTKDLATVCREGAESFVAGMTKAGVQYRFDFSVASASRLDTLIDVLLSADPIADDYQLLMGLYVGEVLVRHLGGQWVEDGTLMQAAIDLPKGRAFPLEKIRKRVAYGRSDSIDSWIHELSVGPPRSDDEAQRRGWRRVSRRPRN